MVEIEGIQRGIQRHEDVRGIWRPVLFDPTRAEDLDAINELAQSAIVAFVHDSIMSQLMELQETRLPSLELNDEELASRVRAHLDGTPASEHGRWVFYPWSGRLVHVLPEDEYLELRTSRNRNKITVEEQAALRRLKIGIVGLSVGQATAVTMAMEEVGGHFVLADFDELALSNMNRLRSGAHDIGVNKAVLAARQIFEMNPYAKVSVFPEGIGEENMEAFLTSGGALDLLVEECDDFFIKVTIRERARDLGIPVIMEASDRGLLDIERFDLEPGRPLLHGLIEGLDVSEVKDKDDTAAKVPLVFAMIGGTAISPRLAASMVELDQTLKTWPQLASAIALGGALNTNAARRIALGELNESGRFYVDLEEIISDGRGIEIKPPAGAEVSPEALQGLRLPPVRATGNTTLSKDQVRSLVRHGILAPSGGNAQPWRFEYGSDELRCYLVPERSKVFLDYDHLASYLAIGAFVENVHLTSEQLGMSAQIEPFPISNEPLLVCRIRFTPSHREPADSELFEQITIRTTNRKPGSRTRLDPQHSDYLAGVCRQRGGRLNLIHDPDKLDVVANMLGVSDRLRFTSAIMHSELIDEIRWSPDEVEQSRDGLDVATLELSALDLIGFRLSASPRVMSLVGAVSGGRALEKPTRKSIGAASAVGLVTVPMGQGPEAMFQGGRALQRVWLGATALGYSFQPMTVIVCLFWRLLGGGHGLSTRELREIERLRAMYLGVFDVKPDEGESMLFRIGRADPPSARSLRRPVDDVLAFRP